MPYSEIGKTGSSGSSSKNTLIFLTLVIFAGIVVYISSLASRFAYDDIKLIVINPHIRDISHLKELIAGGRPIRALTFMLDYALWGYNPRGYHLTNLILHLIGAVLWFSLLLKLFRSVLLPFVSALFFVVNPVTTEAVVAVSHRKEMLAFIFICISLLFYLSASAAKDNNDNKLNLKVISFYFLSLLSYLTGLGAKQVVIVTPVLMWGVDTLFSGRTVVRTLKERGLWYAPYVLIPALLLILNKGDWRLFGAFPRERLFSGEYFDILSASFWAIGEYFKVLLFPVHLHIDHKVPPPSIWHIFSGAVLSVVIVLSVWKFRRYPQMSFGLFWLILNLVPVLNIIPANEVFAERYLYIPSAGFNILLACALIYISKNKKFVVFFLPIFYLLLALLVSFWWRVVVKYPAEIPPQALVVVMLGTFSLYGVVYLTGRVKWLKNLAVRTVIVSLMIGGIAFTSPAVVQRLSGEKLFWEKSDYAGLMSAFRVISPNEAEKFTQPALKRNKLFNFSMINFLALGLVAVLASWRNQSFAGEPIKGVAGIFLMTTILGTLCISRVQDWRTDRTLWSSTLKHNPESVRSAVNLGVTYRRFGDYRRAFFAYGKAVKLDPSNFLAHYNLAIALLKLGRVPEAKLELARTIELNPLHVEAYGNLGNILVVENKLDDAIEIYRRALAIRPHEAQLWYNLSVALDGKGEHEEALRACRKALSIKPDFPSAEQFCGYGESGIPLK